MSVCEFNHILYYATTIHIMLLILSAYPVLVGELEPGGAVVLFISVVINAVLLSIAVGLLLFCRRATSYDES